MERQEPFFGVELSKGSEAAAVLWSREVARTAWLRRLPRRLWKMDDCRLPLRRVSFHEDLPLKPPPDPGRRDRLGILLTSTSAFTASIRLSFQYFFHPLGPLVALFYSSLASLPGQSLTQLGDKCAGANAPFFPFLFNAKDKTMFQNDAGCFACLRRGGTFGQLWRLSRGVLKADLSDGDNNGCFSFSLIRWMLCRRINAGTH